MRTMSPGKIYSFPCLASISNFSLFNLAAVFFLVFFFSIARSLVSPYFLAEAILVWIVYFVSFPDTGVAK